MEKNKKKSWTPAGKSHEVERKNKNMEPIVLFFTFLLVNNTLGKKSFSSEKENISDDEFTVTMGKNPAFPLEKKTTKDKTQKKALFKLKDSQEIYHMIHQMKPYMSAKNQRMVSLFERWRDLLEDMNEIAELDNSTDVQSSPSFNPNNILNFFHDIKPFVHEDYHAQLQDLAVGINNMLELQKNVNHLVQTFNQINQTKNQSQRVNHLIDAMLPFMPEEKKNKVSQFKNLSKMMDTMNMAETLKKSSPKGKKNNSSLMELLDLLDSPTTSKESDKKQGPALTSIAKESTENSTQKVEEDFEEVLEEDFEEIFEEEEEDQS